MELMSWTDKLRTLGVTNSDARAVQQAIKFGAEGIGLTRAEACSSRATALMLCVR